ncbi:hypothetical protein OROMI_034646 [Orobanche minor]
MAAANLNRSVTSSGSDAASSDNHSRSDSTVQVVWRRPLMRGMKSSINGYIRLQFVDMLRVELSAIGDDFIDQFRASFFGHLIRTGWCRPVPNATMHALFCREIVRPGRDDEFWYHFGQHDIRFSRSEYAIVTGLRFDDSDFDVRTAVAPPAGGVYQRYSELRRSIALDRVRDLFVAGHFRAQDGDALKVTKVLSACYLVLGVDGNKHIADRWLWTLVEDTSLWRAFRGVCILIRFFMATYERRSHSHLLSRLAVTMFMIWACEAIPSLGVLCGTKLTDPEIQRQRLTRWQLKKLGPIDFSSLFDEEEVNVGLNWEVGPTWFQYFVDPTELLEEACGCYMGILQFDPAFLGLTKKYPRPFVLIDMAFTSACRDIYRRCWSDLAAVPEYELSFLAQCVHGLRPFWGSHQPWWELDEVWSVCLVGPSVNGHWIVLRIELKSRIIVVYDSLRQGSKSWIAHRCKQFKFLQVLLPMILERRIL